MSHFSLFFPTFVAFFLISSPIKAESVLISPQEKVKNIFSLVRKKEIIRDKSLQKKVMDNVHLPSIVKVILDSFYEKRNKKELKWFTNSLKEIISLTVYPRAPSFLEKVKIRYKKTKKDGEKALVYSLVKDGRETAEVNYSMQLVDGKWKVVDLSIDGESWVESIMAEVKRTLEKSKWKGLEDKMNRRLFTLKDAEKKKASKDAVSLP